MPKGVMPRNLILAGPRPHRGEVGGVVVLFEDLVRSVPASVKVFDTNPRNNGGAAVVMARFVILCWRAARAGYEIALHGTAAHFTYLGAVLWVFRAFGLRYHLRKFAGGFQRYYETRSRATRALLDRVLRGSEQNFFETRALVTYFGSRNPRTYWLPNYRSSSNCSTKAVFSGRFVFVGQVRREKGIGVILELRRKLPAGWLIDVYGPLVDYREQDFGDEVRYRGILAPNDVAKELARYNALILPTSHADEGYPGVIIEAFSVALPVIATRVGGIPEIVSCENGVLVEACPERLVAGMQCVSAQYEKLRNGAAKAFGSFEREVVLQSYRARVGIAPERKEAGRLR